MSDLTAAALSQVTRLALLAQRMRWPAPRFLRSAGRKFLSRLGDDGQLVDGWSSPLIAHAGAGNIPMPRPVQPERAQASGRRPIAHPQQPGFRCLIATSVLDSGGLDEFVAFLARRMRVHRVGVSVMVTAPPNRDGELMKCLREEGVEVIHDSLGAMRRWLAANPPDVISAHDPSDWLLDVAAELRIPVVETLHGVPNPATTDWRKEVSRSQLIHGFIAVSDLVRKQYIRGNSGFDPRAIVTIPNGYNDSHRRPVDRVAARQWLGLGNEFLFLSLGRHVMSKNAYGLLSAFADIARAHPQAHLLIAGRMDDSLYMRHVAELRRRSSAPDRIHLRASFSDPSILLSAADCFVMNSFFEGWPLASMEALCAGLPTIMSDVGGAREQLGENGEFGVLVPNPGGDPEVVDWAAAARHRFGAQPNKAALVAAMNAMILEADAWRPSRLSRARRALERFDPQACVEGYVQFLGRAAVVKS